MYLLIVFLPLLGSSVAGFFGRFLGSEGTALITTTCVSFSSILSLIAFYEVAPGFFSSSFLSFYLMERERCSRWARQWTSWIFPCVAFFLALLWWDSSVAFAMDDELSRAVGDPLYLPPPSPLPFTES